MNLSTLFEARGFVVTWTFTEYGSGKSRFTSAALDTQLVGSRLLYCKLGQRISKQRRRPSPASSRTSLRTSSKSSHFLSLKTFLTPSYTKNHNFMNSYCGTRKSCLHRHPYSSPVRDSISLNFTVACRSSPSSKPTIIDEMSFLSVSGFRSRFDNLRRSIFKLAREPGNPTSEDKDI